MLHMGSSALFHYSAVACTIIAGPNYFGQQTNYEMFIAYSSIHKERSKQTLNMDFHTVM